MMDKASERKKDSKKYGDTDLGVHRFGPGNVIDRMDGLWSIPSKEVVGLGPERILTNNYCKSNNDKKEKVDLMDELLDNGPPMLNISAPKRVL